MIKYDILNDYLIAWRSSDSLFGLLLTGDVGIGKTYILEDYLKGDECILINSHVTPLSLFITLYQHKSSESYIIIDDVLELFKNKETSGLLLSATQTGKLNRTLTYNSTTDKLGEVPSSFVYNGKIAIICNKLPNRLDHLKSRCFYYDLKLTFSERINKIIEVGKSMNVDSSVINFIVKYSNESTPKDILNIRLLLKINSLHRTSKDWKRLGLHIINQDESLYALKKILSTYSNPKKQIEEYTKLTGLGKGSFYKHKKQLI